MNFAPNSTLDNKGHPLPDSFLLMDHIVISFTTQQVSNLIKNLHSMKSTGPDKICLVVLKLSPIIAKELSLMEKHFPNGWKVPTDCPVFKDWRKCLSCLIIDPSASLMSSANKKVIDHLNRNNILSNKWRGLNSSRSTADLWTAITLIISEV